MVKKEENAGSGFADNMKIESTMSVSVQEVEKKAESFTRKWVTARMGNSQNRPVICTLHGENDEVFKFSIPPYSTIEIEREDFPSIAEIPRRKSGVGVSFSVDYEV